MLDEIPPYKYMELAPSFDQSYTIEEVQALIPENVTLAWYWVDDIIKEDRETLQSREVEQSHPNGEKYIMSYPARVRSEKTAYGIKAYNQHGKFYEDPVEQFIGGIEYGRQQKSRYQWEFQELYNTFAGQGGTLDRSKIGIIGAVVTGDKENLEELRDLPFIRASSLGVVTDKF